MSKVNRSYFGIYAPDQLAKVVTVIERKNGDLIIAPSSPPQSSPYTFSTGDDYQENMLDETEFPSTDKNQVSVHVSPDSAGHLIVRHQEAGDGSYIKQYLRYLPSDENNAFPVFAMRAPALWKAEHALVKRSPDEAVRILGSYDPKNSALLYAIFVTAPGARPSIKMFARSYALDFSCFSIHILWGFAWGTTGGKSIIKNGATAIDEQGGHGRYERNSEGVMSMSTEELTIWLDDALELLTGHHTAVFLRLAAKNNFTIPKDDLPGFGRLYRYPPARSL